MTTGVLAGIWNPGLTRQPATMGSGLDVDSTAGTAQFDPTGHAGADRQSLRQARRNHRELAAGPVRGELADHSVALRITRRSAPEADAVQQKLQIHVAEILPMVQQRRTLHLEVKDHPLEPNHLLEPNHPL